MAHTKKKVFDGLYAQLEETDGNVVLFSAKGEPSVIFEMTNPVQTALYRCRTVPSLSGCALQRGGRHSARAMPCRSRTFSASKPTTMRYRKMRSS